MIDFIPNEKIDFKKWDKCIQKAFNGNIFAYSWYLNIVSRKWNALVEDDYERVMPLPQTLLAGNEIIIHPKLAGQLGIFSISTLNEFHISSFVNSIPDNFRYVNLKLNKHNHIHESIKKTEKKINLDIDLIKSYDKLREFYPDLLKDLLTTGYKNDFRVVTKISVDSIARFEQSKSPLHVNFHPEELISLQLLVAASINNKMGQLCGLYSNNNLVALAFFVWSHQKATLAFCLFNDKKMQLPAFFFLINDFIRNNSEKNLILHFEINSNSRLVSAFERIGAKKSESFYLYRNQLPWYLKPFVT